MFKFNNSWDELLAPEAEADYYKALRVFLKSEYLASGVPIYPEMNNIFNAFKYTDYNSVRAVIIGQDPYHGEGQAHGLCFSVRKGVEKPPSLVNIFKEIQSDLGITPPNHGELTQWAQNGVMLLNSVLTVRAGSAGSHRGKGWEIFTDKAISLLNERKEPIVFLLWGNYARAKKSLITNKHHLILESAHPSPLSAYNGFFGCKHFSKCNEFLRSLGKEEINWKID
ncbi:MAG: uracil-DNA glycosylase [Ruminococcaceae bacterium]|nr:uracil-DNA glycosylase [Oscillospiraceae bacterium]